MATGKVRLVRQRYGKARVRVLKVRRQNGRHEIKDLEAQVMLEGAFDAAYLAGDNTSVVPTDTMKNTVQALARDHLMDELEPFALVLGQHFLQRHRHVSCATIRLTERAWDRMQFDDRPEAHSFVSRDDARRFTVVRVGRDQQTVESGVENLAILKSTGSGFVGFPRDEFTTLPETTDRILATRLQATWEFTDHPTSFAQAHTTALTAMLRVFAAHYSPSVQTTLFQMAEAALEAVPEMARVTLSMPNMHCLLVNLKPFGRDNPNEIFTPTDEPHGLIEATVERGGEGS